MHNRERWARWRRNAGILALNRSLEDEIELYLASGKYPERCRDKAVKRSFRRKANKIRVEENQLYYITKKNSSSSSKTVLSTLVEQKRAFQVCLLHTKSRLFQDSSVVCNKMVSFNVIAGVSQKKYIYCTVSVVQWPAQLGQSSRPKFWSINAEGLTSHYIVKCISTASSVMRVIGQFNA